MERRRSTVIKKTKQLNQAPEIQYNQTSVSLVNYVIKSNRTKWSFQQEEQEQAERNKSVVRTDKGEYATSVRRQRTTPYILMYQYGGKISRDDENFFSSKNIINLEKLD